MLIDVEASLVSSFTYCFTAIVLACTYYCYRIFARYVDRTTSERRVEQYATIFKENEFLMRDAGSVFCNFLSQFQDYCYKYYRIRSIGRLVVNILGKTFTPLLNLVRKCCCPTPSPPSTCPFVVCPSRHPERYIDPEFENTNSLDIRYCTYCPFRSAFLTHGETFPCTRNFGKRDSPRLSTRWFDCSNCGESYPDTPCGASGEVLAQPAQCQSEIWPLGQGRCGSYCNTGESRYCTTGPRSLCRERHRDSGLRESVIDEVDNIFGGHPESRSSIFPERRESPFCPLRQSPTTEERDRERRSSLFDCPPSPKIDLLPRRCDRDPEESVERQTKFHENNNLPDSGPSSPLPRRSCDPENNNLPNQCRPLPRRFPDPENSNPSTGILFNQVLDSMRSTVPSQWIDTFDKIVDRVSQFHNFENSFFSQDRNPDSNTKDSETGVGTNPRPFETPLPHPQSDEMDGIRVYPGEPRFKNHCSEHKSSDKNRRCGPCGPVVDLNNDNLEIFMRIADTFDEAGATSVNFTDMTHPRAVSELFRLANDLGLKCNLSELNVFDTSNFCPPNQRVADLIRLVCYLAAGDTKFMEMLNRKSFQTENSGTTRKCCQPGSCHCPDPCPCPSPCPCTYRCGLDDNHCDESFQDFSCDSKTENHGTERNNEPDTPPGINLAPGYTGPVFTHDG